MINNFWVFALTGLLLNLTPGNDMIYVIGRSSGQGMKAGVISALGIGAGCLVHIFAAVAGLSAIIANSATAFNLIKWSGALYLVLIGIRSVLSANRSSFSPENLQPLSYKKIFWTGVLTNVLNPKVALFFLAFLPQFIDVNAGHTALQILFLGVWFDVVGTIVNILVAIMFGKLATLLFRSPLWIQWQQRITGAVLIALGIKLAFSFKKST